MVLGSGTSALGHLPTRPLASSRQGTRFSRSFFTGPSMTPNSCQGYALVFMSSLIAGTGSAQGHGFSVERHAGMPRPQSHSKTKQQIGAVSYRKRSIETQTAVVGRNFPTVLLMNLEDMVPKIAAGPSHPSRAHATCGGRMWQSIHTQPLPHRCTVAPHTNRWQWEHTDASSRCLLATKLIPWTRTQPKIPPQSGSSQPLALS